MGYSYGVNRYYLHSWAHNPFDDKYQPGFSFAHYGTHFSRNQTWFEPGKAFFTYLARCQMLLQQGSFVSRISDEVLMRRTPEADIFFLRNTGDAQEKTFVLPVAGSKPELWDAYTGTVSTTSNYSEKEPRQTSLTLKMEKDASIFAIFPRYVTKYPKTPEQRTVKETTTEAVGAWTVNFAPKTDEKPFKRTFAKLDDFSKLPDDAVKYFSGTATYQKTFTFSKADLSAGKRVVLDLGKVCDIAALEINGQDAGVLWTAPFRTDITKFLKAGSNVVKIKVSNTWVNRLIGDEQYPEDFEWTDRNQGLRAMKYLPDWFVKDEPRPVRERKTFVPWYYYRKDSRLQPAGLLGPVSIVKQNVE
jgi:hypothetical protein